MNKAEPVCAICHIPRQGDGSWFLLIEKHREDKLRVLEWDDYLASQEGVHCACSSFHVQQLVAHWMTTGTLCYPIAESKRASRIVLPWPKPRHVPKRIATNLSSGKPLGELSVHRESLNRVLQEQPESLMSILDALMSALESADGLHSTIKEHRERNRAGGMHWRARV